MSFFDRDDSGSEENNSVTASNNSYFQSVSALQIRLDTSSVVRQLEMYLKGSREEVYSDNEGNIKTRMLKVGNPLVNNRGLQAIMKVIETVFNAQVVQGNFNEDQYNLFLFRTRRDLAVDLMLNLNEYGIKEENYNGIITTIMRFVEPFMSRLVNNKERESYANTIKSVESNTTRPLKQGFSLPFGN